MYWKHKKRQEAWTGYWTKMSWKWQEGEWDIERERVESGKKGEWDIERERVESSKKG